MIVVTGGLAVITAPTVGYTTIPAGNLIESVARRLGRYGQGKAYAGTSTTARLDDQNEASGYWDNHWLYSLAGTNNGGVFVVTDWNGDTKYATFTRPAGLSWKLNDTYRLLPFDHQGMLTTSSSVRGVLDRAIDMSYPTLIYQIANDDLVLLPYTYEYSWRYVGGAKSWISKLRAVQYRANSLDDYANMVFNLVGDGSSFHIPSLLTSYQVRLLGDGPILRTNSTGTVIVTLTNESDRITVEEGAGHEALIVALAAKILLEEQTMPFTDSERAQKLNSVMREIAFLESQSSMSIVSQPLGTIF